MKRFARRYTRLFKRGEAESSEVNQKPAELEPDDHDTRTGLKLLYNGSHPKVEYDSLSQDLLSSICAVHGLGGHYERSWSASNGVNWLQTLLPSDLPDSRIFTWGWSVSATGMIEGVPASQKISEKLVEDLYNARDFDATHSRPIIFIAHSQGGTVVKSAILYSKSKESKRGSPGQSPLAKSDLSSIELSTRGTIFMGTPELDSRLTGLKTYMSALEETQEQQNSEFKEAKWMISTLQSYSLIAKKFQNCFVYEVSNPESSSGGRTQPPFQRLSPHIVINGSHDGMIKFESSCDENYMKIKAILLDMVRETAASTKWPE